VHGRFFCGLVIKTFVIFFTLTLQLSIIATPCRKKVVANFRSASLGRFVYKVMLLLVFFQVACLTLVWTCVQGLKDQGQNSYALLNVTRNISIFVLIV
jgi:hypothetical protein